MIHCVYVIKNVIVGTRTEYLLLYVEVSRTLFRLYVLPSTTSSPRTMCMRTSSETGPGESRTDTDVGGFGTKMVETMVLGMDIEISQV